MERELVRARRNAMDQNARPGPHGTQPVRCRRLFGYPDRGFSAEVHEESLGAALVDVIEVGIGPPALIQGKEACGGFHGFAVYPARVKAAVAGQEGVHHFAVHIIAHAIAPEVRTPIQHLGRGEPQGKGIARHGQLATR